MATKQRASSPSFTQFRFQTQRLLLGKPPDRRASADGCIVMLYFAGARGRNQFGQSFTAEPGKRKVNNIGIAEKVIKERLYRSQRIRPAQLKQNYSHTARCARHPPDSPERANLLPSATRVNGGSKKMADMWQAQCHVRAESHLRPHINQEIAISPYGNRQLSVFRNHDLLPLARHASTRTRSTL